VPTCAHQCSSARAGGTTGLAYGSMSSQCKATIAPKKTPRQRLAVALHGGDFDVRPARPIVFDDSMHIIGTIAFATGAVPDSALRISYAICKRFSPASNYWIERNIDFSERGDFPGMQVIRHLELQHRRARLPKMVLLLDEYDKAQRTSLAGQASLHTFHL